MRPTINDQDRAVAEYLKACNIKYMTILTKIGAVWEGWEHDAWLITIGAESFQYKTGTGHRCAPFKTGDQRMIKERCRLIGGDIRGLSKDTMESVKNPNKRSIRSKAYTKTVPPTQASVLHSLISDAQMGRDSTFNEFCDDLGYDNDTRNAEAMYRACQETSEQLGRIFTRGQLEALGELLEDY